MKKFMLFFLLSGCSYLGLGEDNCNLDWEILGEVDAKNGKGIEEFLTHQKRCNASKKRPDKKLYQKGHKKGLKRYCNKEHGQMLGRQGKSFSHICSGNGQRNLYKGWMKGLEIFCSYENGIVLGKSGKAYISICPAKFEKEYRRGYFMGKENFDLDKKIDDVEVKRKQIKNMRKSYYQKINKGNRCEWNSDCPSDFTCRFSKCIPAK
jgi:hypothetical protein